MDYLVDNEGITSFKLFMAYPGVFYSDDGQILRAMQKASENGAMIMMHAENGIAIDVLVAQALARGETDPKYHGLTRPSSSRARRPTGPSCWPRSPATCRSTSCTCRRREALERWPRPATRARNVFAETCPQYLYLTLEDQLGPARLRGRQVGLLARRCARKHDAPPGRPVEGPAHQRPGRRVHRPLPVLHEGPEGARASATSPRSRTASAASSTGWT